ncbi:MAG: hypothetical protein ACKOYM_06315 [Actinomycetes bacterium]
MRRIVAALTVATCTWWVAGCSDGTPEFCTSLAKQADMSRLSAALEARDLARARREAERFAALAARAPEEIAPDLTAVADGVNGVVRLLGATASGTPSADLQRQRNELSKSLESVGRNSAAVSRWASAECGIRL